MLSIIFVALHYLARGPAHSALIIPVTSATVSRNLAASEPDIHYFPKRAVHSASIIPVTSATVSRNLAASEPDIQRA